jgi:hypothetical protein
MNQRLSSVLGSDANNLKQSIDGRSKASVFKRQLKVAKDIARFQMKIQS